MIKWLSWKIVKWAQDHEAFRNYREQDRGEDTLYPVTNTVKARRGQSMAIASSEVDLQRTFRFDVTIARGGILVTTRRYDPKTDRHDEIITVIHEDEDTNKKIADIVSLEILKS